MINPRDGFVVLPCNGAVVRSCRLEMGHSGACDYGGVVTPPGAYSLLHEFLRHVGTENPGGSWMAEGVGDYPERVSAWVDAYEAAS